jgi:hypothetical protein
LTIDSYLIYIYNYRKKTTPRVVGTTEEIGAKEK